ncbi:MAG: NADH-quinone oxidoreductase subunit C [Actinomycetota bacterium]|nr:NADH-quinone oxidoreductase subunit C [Actinomycetota bacterium]
MRQPDSPWPDRVRSAFAERIGEAVVVHEEYGPVSVDVEPQRWEESLQLARDRLGCTFFDWLSAVDELNDGFRVACHVAHHRIGRVEHLIVRALVPRDAAVIPSLAHLFAGARWHERETSEMFGIGFTVDGTVVELEPLLLPENFEGHPLRKDFILASRVAKPFPGAKEPGESADPSHGAAPARRRTRPAGVPEPAQWGPREPDSDEPDTLGAAAAAPPARPRRARPGA